MYLFWITYASTQTFSQFLKVDFCLLSIKLSQCICLTTAILQNKIKYNKKQQNKTKRKNRTLKPQGFHIC